MHGKCHKEHNAVPVLLYYGIGNQQEVVVCVPFTCVFGCCIDFFHLSALLGLLSATMGWSLPYAS